MARPALLRAGGRSENREYQYVGHNLPLIEIRLNDQPKLGDYDPPSPSNTDSPAKPKPKPNHRLLLLFAPTQLSWASGESLHSFDLGQSHLPRRDFQSFSRLPCCWFHTIQSSKCDSRVYFIAKGRGLDLETIVIFISSDNFRPSMLLRFFLTIDFILSGP